MRAGRADDIPPMDLRESLARIVGERHTLDDPELRAPYERDWTGRFGAPARLVVRPADSAEVAAVVRACAQAGVPIVPQGGNTGMVGASVPRNGEVLLSLARLRAVGMVDDALGQVTVGAGVTLAALQAACAAVGKDAGLDFAARDSCTIGGVVACDAGGARALRHGTARAHVVGLEAVLADGSIISRLHGLMKDNAGYDLPALLVGSEGTLRSSRPSAGAPPRRRPPASPRSSRLHRPPARHGCSRRCAARRRRSSAVTSSATTVSSSSSRISGGRAPCAVAPPCT